MEKRVDTRYATEADFCRIFKDNLNPLYLLSFLLTRDHATAEECFVGGLVDSQRSNPVFNEWAQSWARRMIIANAIRIVKPRPDGESFVHGRDGQNVVGSGEGVVPLPYELASVLDLADFDRFVFVLRVLEGYSDRECSLLLGCTVKDLSAARARIFQQIASAADLREAQPTADVEKPASSGLVTAILTGDVVHLAATA